MAKYKICPVCGEHNQPVMLECCKCEADLSGTRVIDEDTEKAQAEQASQKSVLNTLHRMVRICDCGQKNPMQSRKCSSCGEDISMIIPTPDTESAIIKYVMSSLDGEYAYEVKGASTIIGRENEMREYLSKKSFVSRKHAELQLEDDKLFITNFSHTNYTYINNEKIDDENRRELHDGDEVGLGGNSQDGQRQDDAAYFVIRIGSCI